MQAALIQFWVNHSEQLLKVGYRLLLVVFILFASKLIARLIRKLIENVSEKSERMDATLVPIFSSIATYTVYAIGLAIILDLFGVNTGSIIAIFGAAGLAIGLALKDTLSNIAAGFMLIALRPFRVNDSIEVGSISGSVKEINLFTTVLETPDGLFVSAPNGTLWGNSIKNFTRNGKRRLDIVVGIAYSDSIDKGLDVLRKILAEDSSFLNEPAPQVMVHSLGESAVNLQLRGWIPVGKYWGAYWDLNKKVKEEIEAAGLSIPFPQRNLHIFQAPLAETKV